MNQQYYKYFYDKKFMCCDIKVVLCFNIPVILVVLCDIVVYHCTKRCCGYCVY